jgi:DNA-binding MarR family transcriptional regulator
MSKKHVTDPTLADSISVNMLKLMPLLKKRLLHMENVQRIHGTPMSHVQVLSMLDETGRMTISELSRRLGIAKPNITPLIDKLYEAGYVDRQHGDNDRRVVNIVILDAGREKLAAILQTISENVQQQVEVLSAADYKELESSMNSIVRILNDL